jgi:DinB superfamily
VDARQIDVEMRRAQADFHRLIARATPEDLRSMTDGTRWTNRELLFHMVLGYGVVRTLLPLVHTLGRLGHSRGFATALNARRRLFHWINCIGPCVAARLLPLGAIAALLDRSISSLRRRLAIETDRSLALTMHMPTDWDPYFTPTMSVLGVYHFGTQHFDHHRRQLTLPESQAEPRGTS